MPRTRNGPGVASRPASKVTTCSQSTHAADIERAYEAGFCQGWLDRAEYARRNALTFDDGYEFGWHAAHRAMRTALAEVTAGMPHASVEIVRQLVRVWDRPVKP